VDDPEVSVVKPEQLEAECETYPTEVICEGGLNVGVSVPVVVTVKAPDEGGQAYLSVPEPGVGPPLRVRVPPHALDVTAACAGITIEGIVSVVAATATPTNRTPTRIKIRGLPYEVWSSLFCPPVSIEFRSDGTRYLSLE
jgi:hypothetical protein